jgi:hypothetical protein
MTGNDGLWQENSHTFMSNKLHVTTVVYAP